MRDRWRRGHSNCARVTTSPVIMMLSSTAVPIAMRHGAQQFDVVAEFDDRRSVLLEQPGVLLEHAGVLGQRAAVFVE